MITNSVFDDLVASLYSAATGAISWDFALQGIQQAIGARVAALQSIDLKTGAISSLQHGGVQAHQGVLDYVRHWHAVDPRRQYLLAHRDATVDRWWHCHEKFDDAFARRNVFYQQFLPGQETRYLAVTTYQITPTSITLFGFELPSKRGPLSAEERVIAERLGRHVKDALCAYERVRRVTAQTIAGHGLLDAFSYPMWLLEPDRFVYFSNSAAKALESRPDGWEIESGRLFAGSPKVDRAFGIHLHSLRSAGHGTRVVVDAQDAPDQPRSKIHLQVFLPGNVLGAFGDRPQILATLFHPSQLRALDPYALGNIFGMTPAEGRVGALLGDGLTAYEIASRLGCAIGTVRIHIRRVMAKLGAVRSADAVRMLRQGEALWSQPLSLSPGRFGNIDMA